MQSRLAGEIDSAAEYGCTIELERLHHKWGISVVTRTCETSFIVGPSEWLSRYNGVQVFQGFTPC